MKTRILYTKPSITQREVDYAGDAAANGWGEHCYDYINRFEREFAAYLNVRYAVATSSCTGALHLGLSALGIGLDDEIVMADTNWIATASPVVQLGAKPVFVDILPDSWCLDPSKVAQNVTSRTRAIIAVHLYGNLCNMNELRSIGEEFAIPVIEDAAEAIGSIYHGVRAGAIGRFGVFSFHGTKTLTTGEGGMLVTNDRELYEQALVLNNHGRAGGETKQFWPSRMGFKYKMSNIQAAIGCAQLERIDELVDRKREILSNYRALLHDIGEVELNPEPPDTINGAWMPTAVFRRDAGINRETLQAAFLEENIDARVFFWPLSSLPMFSAKPENEVAWDIPCRAINLPSYHDMTDEQQERVVATLRKLLRR